MATPVAKRRKFELRDELTVLVGPPDSERRFSIHKDVLCARSKFFAAAVSKGFQEEKEQLVWLLEVDAAVFCTYAQWSYSGQVVPLSPEDLEKDEKGKRTREGYVELYILADYLKDTRLCNTILPLMTQSFVDHHCGPCETVIRRTWESTRDASKIRQLFLDWHVTSHASEWLEARRASLPTRFFVDLALEFAKKGHIATFAAEVAKANKCKYHEHGEDTPPCT